VRERDGARGPQKGSAEARRYFGTGLLRRIKDTRKQAWATRAPLSVVGACTRALIEPICPGMCVQVRSAMRECRALQASHAGAVQRETTRVAGSSGEHSLEHSNVEAGELGQSSQCLRLNNSAEVFCFTEARPPRATQRPQEAAAWLLSALAHDMSRGAG